MAEIRDRVLAARSREELAGAMEAEGAPEWLMFWGHQPDASELGKGCLSQWWPSRFTVDGAEYASAEHWMMAGKASLFGDSAAREKILAARTPAEAKALGRLVQGFDDAVWAAARFGIVVAGSVHKFGAREDLRGYLLGTRGRVLVEASPRDRIWGIGMSANNENAADPGKWRGANLLGFALMEARERLAAASAG